MEILGNGTVVTRDAALGIIPQGAVAWEEGKIAAVGETAELRNKYPGARLLDAGGGMILPGMINAHMHLYSTFARGLALPDPPRNFVEILQKLWWRLDKALTPDDIYYSALLTLADCIRNGTTTIIDHHASPFTLEGSLEILARAAQETGIRTALAYEVSDRDGQETALKGMEENLKAAGKYPKGANQGLTALFGLHASLTLSDATLRQAAEKAQAAGVGFHIHVAEGLQDQEECLKNHGLRVVERLNRAGILGKNTIAAHCVHVNDREIEILRQTGTMVVHNPESNMGNAVGAAPVRQMLKEGVLVGLGTDGYTSDMFESVKAANLLVKHSSQDPGAGWDEVPQMALVNNREIVSRVFGVKTGCLTPGAAADLIVVDYHPATPYDAATEYAHLLFGMSGGQVKTTVVNGKVLMKDRRLTCLDEEKLAAKARKLAQNLWQRW